MNDYAPSTGSAVLIEGAMDLDQDGSPVDVPEVRREGRNWEGRGGKNGRGICHFKENGIERMSFLKS